MEETTKKPTEHFSSATFDFSYKALQYLGESTGGVTHFRVFLDLVENMSMFSSSFKKHGTVVRLRTRQCEAAVNALAKRWGMGRKPMTRILTTMAGLGLIDISRSKLTSVADVLAVKSWTRGNGRPFDVETYVQQKFKNAANQPNSSSATDRDKPGQAKPAGPGNVETKVSTNEANRSQSRAGDGPDGRKDASGRIGGVPGPASSGGVVTGNNKKP